MKVSNCDFQNFTLGEIAQIYTGKKNTQDKIGDGQYPFFVRSQDVERINTYSFDGEAILVPGEGNIGKIFHYINGKFDFHQRVYKISNFRADMCGKFVFYYLKTFFGAHALNHSVKATVDSLRLPTFKDFQIIVPPLEEQKAIAEVLSDVDELISQTERLIAKKEAIKMGVMQELLRPKEGWSTFSLGEVSTIFKGKGLPKSALTSEGHVPCIHYGELFTKYGRRINDVFSRTTNRDNAVCSVSGDVLMPASDVTPRGLAVASCLQKDEVVLGGDMLIIRPHKEKVDGLFLAHYITHFKSDVLKLVSGSTVYHLYGSDLNDFSIKLPPLEEQKAIAEVLSDVDKEFEAILELKYKYEKLRIGTMHQLLTGKTRLV